MYSDAPWVTLVSEISWGRLDATRGQWRIASKSSMNVLTKGFRRCLHVLRSETSGVFRRGPSEYPAAAPDARAGRLDAAAAREQARVLQARQLEAGSRGHLGGHLGGHLEGHFASRSISHRAFDALLVAFGKGGAASLLPCLCLAGMLRTLVGKPTAC